MSRHCSVCVHPNRDDIEKGLKALRRLTAISAEFGVSGDAIGRHRAHIIEKFDEPIPGSLEAAEITQLKKQAQAEVRAAKDPKVRLLAMGRVASLIELQMRSSQQTEATSLLTAHPAWKAFASELFAVVGGCESCKQALLERLPKGGGVPAA